MARKKSRHPQRSSSPGTAAAPAPSPARTAVAPAPATAITANGNAAPPRSPVVGTATTEQPQSKKKPAERSLLEIVIQRCARTLGSLQMAVILLILFALVVLLGTFMESWYSTKIAQVLVYKSWWFVLLLGLLAVNIFFAAAKKWPWKKHQTGFIITHIGLLILLSGGVLNALGGVDAQAQLIDTPDLEIQDLVRQNMGSMMQSTTRCLFTDTAQLSLRENQPDLGDAHGFHMARKTAVKGKPVEIDFEPGPLPWKSENQHTSDLLLSFMTWLASPFGHSCEMGMQDNTRLEVLDFMPHARRERFSASNRDGFPALKVELRSLRMSARPMDRWLAVNTRDPRRLSDRALNAGPAIIEFIGLCPEPLLEEFKHPVTTAGKGKQGVLAILPPGGGPGDRVALDVEEATNKPHTLPGGLTIKIDKYLPTLMKENPQADDAPVDPVVYFTLSRPGEPDRQFIVFARITGYVVQVERGFLLQGADPDLPLFWFHTPDVRQGRQGGQGQLEVKGVLQFVQVPGGALWFRSFSRREDGAFGLEKRDRVAALNTDTDIWGRMQWKFRVVEHLPEAVEEERYMPAPVAAGKDTEEDNFRYPAVIRCKLSTAKNAKEFWLQRDSSRIVDVDGREFTIAYRTKEMNLGFELKLERAEQTVDPGTRAAATYTSYVQLFDKEEKLDGVRKIITMNEPLEHRGLKFYQSTYKFLGTYDANGRPVSLSGFTVGRDPGLELKYLGSVLLALGIFTMFYMKAYFFKPKGRATAPATPAPPGQPA